MSKVNKLMIVSHPDDETVFGGIELLTNRGEYRVVCLDYYSDKVRKEEFYYACKLLGVKEENIQMYNAVKIKNGYDKKSLDNVLTNELYTETPWERVVTHNSHGEYGHKRHIAVHNAVKDLVKGFDNKKVLYEFWNTRLGYNTISYLGFDDIDSYVDEVSEIIDSAYQSQKKRLVYIDHSYNCLKPVEW